MALTLGIGRVHAASDSGGASLESTDQTEFLTAIKDSAVPSADADYVAILNDAGLFVSVNAGTVTFTIPGEQTVTVDAGDTIVITGDASIGTYIDVLNGSADLSNGTDDDGNPAFVSVSTSIGIATVQATSQPDLSEFDASVVASESPD
ncbi:MAG TPA: hypothetical protein VH951_01395 [Dehalococcoidia bacterium]